MTRDELVAKLRDLRPWLIDQGVGRIRLFGSYARDDAKPDSDVDLLVDLVRPLGLEFFGIEHDLSQRLGVKVDLLTERFMHRMMRERAVAEAIDI